MYRLKISKRLHFDTIVGKVSIEMSFTHVSKSIQVTRNIHLLPQSSGICTGTVWMYVQHSAINFQKIRELLSANVKWAYSIVLYSPTIRSDSYVDVWVRVCIFGAIKNMYLVDIPVTDSHTGYFMFKVVNQVHQSVIGMWGQKAYFCCNRLSIKYGKEV